MPQSLVNNYMHITYSTKNRYPFIDMQIKDEIFSYLGGICKNLECNPLIVGGHKDHIHILCLLSRKIALMKLIEELKTHSSKWIKTKEQQYQKFYWQNGYGGFSIHPDKIEVVRNYIPTQDEHHKKISFKEEYCKFPLEYDIPYD